jgi:XTP/dITP diphosphohydrolase
MKLIFASHNAHKATEIQRILPSWIEIKTLSDLHYMDEIPENEATIEGNSQFKARFIHEKFEQNCFADDTGLEISSLNGRPGVHSARYAGEQRDSNDNMNKVLEELALMSDRSAQFKTVITLYWEGAEHQFEGIVRGQIATLKTGSEGFGYDPIFIPEGETRSFAEMTLEEKNQYSHRARAIEKLVAFFNKRPSHL